MLQWPLPTCFLHAAFIAAIRFVDSAPIDWPTVVTSSGWAVRTFWADSGPQV